MDLGLNLSEKEIAGINTLLQTNNNKAHFSYQDKEFYIHIDTFSPLATEFFENREATDFKEKVINGIMIDGLGKSFVSTAFSIKKACWIRRN